MTDGNADGKTLTFSWLSKEESAEAVQLPPSEPSGPIYPRFYRMSSHSQPPSLSLPPPSASLSETSAGAPSTNPNNAPAELQASSSFPYTAFIENETRRTQMITQVELTPHEISLLREMLRTQHCGDLHPTDSVDSDYPVFGESTHAWAVFADNPKKRAGMLDRAVGLLILFFQLFTYWMFAGEAIEDYQSGQVAVTTRHGDCLADGESPESDNLVCEAGFTNDFDAFVAFFMLGIFLAGDFIQAFKVIRLAQGSAIFYAILAAFEVFAAFLSASISVSYELYIGEVTDAVEVGVGLLFIRELSQRAYVGIRDGEAKQYKVFFAVLVILVTCGMMMDPLCEWLFAYKGSSSYR